MPELVETTITVTPGTTGPYNVSRPSVIENGDVLVMACFYRAEAATFPEPTGWTAITDALVDTGLGTGVLRLHGKRITDAANEPTTYSVSAGGGVTGHGNFSISRITGATTEDPFWEALATQYNASSVNLATPGLTTLGDDRLIVRVVAGIANGTNPPWDSPVADAWWTTSGSNIRFQKGGTEAAATAGAYAAKNAVFGTAETSIGVSFAIIPADTGPTETLRPVSGGSTTNLSSYDHTALDEDADSGGTDFLTGTDPGGTPITVRSSTPAIATVQGTTTSTTVVIPNDVVNNDILIFVVTNGDGTAQPTVSDNSGVGSWAVHHNQAGAAVGVSVWWKRVTNQATERGKTVTASGLTGSSCCGITTFIGCELTGSPFDQTAVGEGMASGDLTMAGITTQTAGAMVCWAGGWTDDVPALTTVAATDPASLTLHLNHISSGGSDSRVALAAAAKQSPGATGNITIAGVADDGAGITFALKPESPGVTTNTEVRAPMSDPVDALAIGADTGRIKAQVRKLGGGASPTVTVTVRNAAGTLLATPISGATVSATATTGQVVSGTFDQDDILSASDVVIWVTSAGATGGLVEVGAIEWIAGVEPPAGTPHSATPNDAVSIADTVIVTIIRGRTVNDGVAVADTVARSVGRARALTDAVTVVDTVTRVASYARPVNDAIAVADAAARSAGRNRAVNDAVSVADSVTGLTSKTRTINDAVTVADTVARALAATRAINDTVTVADAATRIVAYLRAVNDAVAVADLASATLVQLIQRNVNDTVTVADSVTRVAAYLRSVNDAVAVADSAARSAGWNRAINDPVAIADAVTRVAAYLRAVNDPVAIADNVSRTVVGIITRQINDTVAVADSVARVHAHSRTLNDSVTTADSVARALAIVRAVNDAVAIADTVIRAVNRVRTVNDTVTVADSVTRTLIRLITRAITDSVAVADAVTRVAAYKRPINDAVSVADAVTRVAAYRRNVTDAVTVADLAARTVGRTRTITDPVTVADAVARVTGRGRTITDSVTVADSVVRQAAYVRALADALTVADTVTAGAIVRRAILDAIGVADTVVAFKPPTEILFPPASRISRVATDGRYGRPHAGSRIARPRR